MSIIARPTLGDFLQVLFADCRGVLNLRAARDGRPGATSTFCALADTTAIASFLKLHYDENCWAGVATRHDDSSGELTNCVDLPALFVDLDGAVDDVPTAARLEAFALPPTLTIESSPDHIQAYWKLREPLDLQNPADVEQARSLLRRLAATLRGDLSAAEPARVLRLPATWNQKYHPPAAVRIYRADPAALYNPSDFDELLVAEPAQPAAVNGRFMFDSQAQPGQRNDNLFRLGRSLKATKVEPSLILAALKAANAGFADPHTDKEVERIFDSAMARRDRNPPRGEPVAPPPPPPPPPPPRPPVADAAAAEEPSTALSLADVLEALTDYYRQFVVMTPAQQVLMALWTAHTHTIEACETTPYIHITGATKRCGKTLLLELAEAVVRRPWLTGRTTPAALPRKIHAQAPTLLLDETDQALKSVSEYTTNLIGVLNSGYRASGCVSLCLGEKNDVADLKTFCAKALCGIGALPDTIADRSIAVVLRRRTRDETVSRARYRTVRGAAAPLRDALEQWRLQGIRDLKGAEPQLPEVLNDRQQDIWEPLLAIADLAGSTWAERARRAAAELAGAVADDDEESVRLLANVRTLAPTLAVEGVLISERLVDALTQRHDWLWATWAGGKPLTALHLAQLLERFDIRPGQYRVTGFKNMVRGYRVVVFADAWARYAPAQPSSGDEPVSPVATPMNTG